MKNLPGIGVGSQGDRKGSPLHVPIPLPGRFVRHVGAIPCGRPGGTYVLTLSNALENFGL